MREVDFGWRFTYPFYIVYIMTSAQPSVCVQSWNEPHCCFFLVAWYPPLCWTFNNSLRAHKDNDRDTYRQYNQQFHVGVCTLILCAYNGRKVRAAESDKPQTLCANMNRENCIGFSTNMLVFLNFWLSYKGQSLCQVYGFGKCKE